MFTGGAGFELAGIVDRPSDQPDAPVAVFSHCFTCNKDLKAIVRIARALSELGVAVLRFDMTGLGDSGGDFSRTSFTSNLRDLDSAIEFASVELGPVAALIGHSFGGAASLAVAVSSSPSLVSLRCLITLAAPSDTTHLAALLARMDPAIESQGQGSVSIGGRDWRIRQEMLADFRQHDLPRAIAQLKIPLLMFHSPIDQTVGFDHALRIQSLVQGGEGAIPASLIVLDGADHLLVNQPADVDFVATVAAGFINRSR